MKLMITFLTFSASESNVLRMVCAHLVTTMWPYQNSQSTICHYIILKQNRKKKVNIQVKIARVYPGGSGSGRSHVVLFST